MYLHTRFFGLLSAIILLFIIGFVLPFVFYVAVFALFVFMVACILDGLILYDKGISIHAERSLPKFFSLGDENRIQLEIINNSIISFHFNVIDELPDQIQERDFQLSFSLGKGEKYVHHYTIRPTERGEYLFYATNVFISSQLFNLLKRRFQFSHTKTSVPTFPSVIQMKKYEMLATKKIATDYGIKKIRRIGHSYEFEQIRNYTQGDDHRTINWRATGRHGGLMVNQYEDERAQNIYAVIDKSRNMKMPFAGLSLLDYAINTSLALSNIALLKHDQAGLLSFSDKLGSFIKANNHPKQLELIINALYNEKEHTLESNYELLYEAVSQLITRRSLLVLYTNFESKFALENVLPILRNLNKKHLLLVVFFENTELTDFLKKTASTIEDIYTQTMTQRFIAEKQQIIYTLQQYGIQSIITRPEDLSMRTINKYLEFKARGWI